MYHIQDPLTVYRHTGDLLTESNSSVHQTDVARALSCVAGFILVVYSLLPRIIFFSFHIIFWNFANYLCSSFVILFVFPLSVFYTTNDKAKIRREENMSANKIAFRLILSKTVLVKKWRLDGKKRVSVNFQIFL